MMRLIEEASVGNFPTYLLLPTIIIKITQYSIYIIPVSLFFGIILSLGKLYNNNEMAVIFSSGVSPNDIARILASVILPVSLIVALFTLYLTPIASEYRYKLEHRLKNEERVDNIKPGKFNTSASGTSTFFVEKLTNNLMEGVFINLIKDQYTQETVETSKTAKYSIDNKDRKFIVLNNGSIHEMVGNNEIRITRYREHAIQLSQELPDYINSRSIAKSTYNLFFSTRIEDKAELQARLFLPLAAMILGFIAIPLSYSAPKKGKYDKIFLAAIFYFLYFVSISIAKKMYILGYTPSIFGIWWIHIIVLLLLLYFYNLDENKIPIRN
tara:strand:+ start:171920 stop:172897 length:978 start_codon:yes stop_codon:yes gene_type:complete